MLRDSQLWMKIGRICTLLAKRLDISPERAFDIFQMSKTNELLHDERSLLYLMSDLYIVDDVIMELQSATTMANVFEAFAALVVLLRFCCCTTTRCKVVRL